MVAGIMMKSLLSKLATIMGKEFMRLKKLRREVKFISDELTGMKDALEGLSYMDKLDPQTKRWRDTVREMSYHIEDIVDDFMRNEGNEKARGFVSNTVRRLKNLRGSYQIVSKIEDIKKLVLETSARRERYKLDVPKSGNVVIDPRVATLYEDTTKLVGVEGPTNELLNFLRKGENKLKVVSIVGFGGLGKTTLANVVYGKLKSQFCSAFVVVSRKPDIPQLLRSILFQLGSRSCSHECELNALLSEIREHLQHKRYLIIIDDVWNVQAWGVIKCAFPENDLGSRVIVTTRNQDLAKECCFDGHDCILQMKPLSNEHSTRLFLDRTFGSEKPCPPHLGDVLVEILKKCGGLPLAIICISSMLAFEDSKQKERWEHVQNSLGSGTNPTLEGMRGILNLSYTDLPSHLKTCLLYLGMYPEDYIINRSNLEHQWIAEGFISTENGEDVERVARNYFNELVNRSLVQPIEVYNQKEVTKCKVHDMMLDFILSKSAEENFLTIVNDPQDITGLDYNVRRLSIRLNSTSDGRTILPRNTIISQVRSAMFFGSSQHTPSLTRFKFLRVLFFDLDGATIDLNGLCKLYLLRYLWTSYSCSYLLPTQIGVLQHLETIVLPSCGNLPVDIVHLPRLMLLYVDTRLPNGISEMKSLRHLYGFYFTVNNLDNVKGLEELTNLRSLFLNGDLYPEDRERCMDALCSSLGNLCNLETLVVDLDGCIDGLMPLSPPMAPYRLEKLVLEPTCWFSRVPSWMGELHNLSELECKVCELLNEGVGILAELPVLTDLNIRIGEATNEMIVIYGQAFPALKCFKLQSSSSPFLTFQTGAMPKLQRLELTIGAQRSLQNGAMPIGIDNLLSLKELSATIGYFNATESEKTNAESMLKNAINMHPRSPQLVIDFIGHINQEQ